MLRKNMRLLLGDKGRNPNGGLESTRANLLQHALHVSTKCRAGLKPVAHRRLVAVVDLHVTQAGCVLRDEVEIVEDLLRGDARAEAIPGAPARRRPSRRSKAQGRMVGEEVCDEMIE